MWWVEEVVYISAIAYVERIVAIGEWLYRLSEAQWRGRDVPQAPERSPGVYNNVAPPGARVAVIVGLWRGDKIACGRRRSRVGGEMAYIR